jgi:hypothetical protein
LGRRKCGWKRIFHAEIVVCTSLGSLTYFTYRTPEETEEDLQSESWQRVKLYRIGQQPSRGCARIWRVAAMPAMKSVAATSKDSCELTENITIKNLRPKHNMKTKRIFGKTDGESRILSSQGCLPPQPLNQRRFHH